MPYIIILAGVILAALLAGCVGCYFEYKYFNHGICPYCGTKLRHFDTDSQGGRGYTCGKCNYYTWVSYGIVDKSFREDKQ